MAITVLDYLKANPMSVVVILIFNVKKTAWSGD
jgi:hypothetical protein